MKLAIIAPSPVPFLIGGAENLWTGLVNAFNQLPGVEADLIKLPTPERNAKEIVASYRRFAELDLNHFDQVISTKYPAWMVAHPNHVVYLQHKLRGLYDTYPAHFSTELPKQPLLPKALLQAMTRPDPERSLLPELFGRMDEWFAAHPDDHGFDLPGPLLRALVHQLDRIALAPGAIRRYLAISHTVAGRADYFPAGVPVEVLHHPSSLATLPAQAYESIFTASRLDAPKRIDLLLRAYLAAKVDVPFRIAGSGPETEKLKALAAGNPRVQFLGRITEAELAQEYARALFVPFVPYQEDYGLITLEAMQSGKAVLTVADAGGVTELVRPGVNGEVVETSEAALAAAIQQLANQPARTRAMGEAAPASVSHIEWQPLARALLTSPIRRKKVVVANTFPIYPPQGGGQLRLYHLYKGLAEHADVVMVNLALTEQTAGARELAPGFTEILVPRSHMLSEANAHLEQRMKLPCGDVSSMALFKLAPNFIEALRTACRGADVVVASHPYAYPALKEVWNGPIYYESLNVEYDLKQAGYQDSPWLHAVAEVEGECARSSPRVFACSADDARRMAELYQLDPASVSVIPNGTDTTALRYHDPIERAKTRSQYGLAARPLALFMGSMHQPNLEALKLLIEVAQHCPELDFVVMGSVCWGFEAESLPPNVRLLGVVEEEEKLAWLALADIGFNPMLSGSGTNLKILDYAAAGLAIVSTPFGVRGSGLEPGQHVWQAEQAGLAALLQEVAALSAAEKSRFTRAARQRIEETVDWRAISTTYATALLA